MSLDIYLRNTKTITCKCGEVHELETELVYDCNITHNLTPMASEAGIYEALWRPEEINATKASDIIDLLESGLSKMKANRKHFEYFNASNGWGTYSTFVPFVEKYLEACKEYPNAIIEVSR